MEREVLAVLKGLEPVDNDFVDWRAVLHHLLMEEQAMAAEPGYVTVDGFLGHFQVFGNLSIGHASDSFHDNLGVQVGHLLPVGCGKGLCTKTAFTCLAGKPLDTVGGDESSEETNLLVGPGLAGDIVVLAVGVGTEGRGP